MSGLGPLGSNQEATVWRSVGPPAVPQSRPAEQRRAGRPRIAAQRPLRLSRSHRAVTPTFASSDVAGSWPACNRECKSLFKNVCRKVESKWL